MNAITQQLRAGLGAKVVTGIAGRPGEGTAERARSSVYRLRTELRLHIRLLLA